MVTPGAHSTVEGYFSGSSVTTAIFFAPSEYTCNVICGTVNGPSTCWPPVMATASL